MLEEARFTKGDGVFRPCAGSSLLAPGRQFVLYTFSQSMFSVAHTRQIHFHASSNPSDLSERYQEGPRHLVVTSRVSFIRIDKSEHLSRSSMIDLLFPSRSISLVRKRRMSIHLQDKG